MPVVSVLGIARREVISSLLSTCQFWYPSTTATTTSPGRTITFPAPTARKTSGGQHQSNFPVALQLSFLGIIVLFLATLSL